MSHDGYVLDQERIEPRSSDHRWLCGIASGKYQANRDRRKRLQPEMYLWAAVVQQAVEDLTRAQYRDEARRWFLSNEDGPGSLLWICEQLGLNVREVRALAEVGSRYPAFNKTERLNEEQAIRKAV